MQTVQQPGRINVRFLVALVAVVAILGGGAIVGYKIRSRLIGQKALAAGKAALERQDWPEACKQLKQYLSRHPEDPEMLGRYAEANLSVRPLRADQLADAASAYRMLFHRMNDTASGRVLSALYMKLGNFNEAAYVCRQRLERNPSDADARIVLAQALNRQRKPAEAAEQLVGLLRQKPADAQAYSILAGILRQNSGQAVRDQVASLLNDTAAGQTDLSEALLALSIEKCPDSPMLHAMRARYYRTRSYRAGADQNADRALTDMANARAEVEAAEKLTIADPDAHLLLFDECLELGNVESAQAHFAALDKLEPAALREHGIWSVEELALPKLRCAGLLALKNGQGKQGADIAERARKELLRQQWPVFVPLAVRLYLAANKPDEARQALDEARKIVNENPPTEADAINGQLTLLEAELAEFGGRPYEVINTLEPLVLRYPDSRGARRLLVQAYLHTDQVRRAVRASEALIAGLMETEQAQADCSLLIKLLGTCITQGRWSEAQELAQSLRGPAANRPELQVLVMKTDIYTAPDKAVTREQLDGWSAQIGRLSSALPRSADVRILQAILDARQGRIDAAVAGLEKAAQDCEDPQVVSLTLAMLHSKYKNDQAKAIEICAAAADKYPDKAAPRVALAAYQDAGGLKDQAKATLEKAVSELAGGEKARATLELAAMLSLTNDPAEGIKLLEKYAQEQPKDILVRVLLLNKIPKQTDAAARQKLIDEVKAIEGERGLRWQVEQAKAYLQQIGPEIKAPKEVIAGREEQIAGLLRNCITADPQWVEPVLVLGGAYELLGKQDQAEQVYRHLLEARPAELNTLDRLSALLQARGRSVEANDLLTKAPDGLLRESDRLLGRQVEVALAAGDTSRAAAALDEMVSSKPGDAAIRILRARTILVQLGDLNRALKLLDEAEALARTPASAPAEDDARRRDGWLFDALAVRVAILHAQGQDQAAGAMLDQEVEQRKDYQSYLLRAQFRTTLGQMDLAEQDYIRLTELPDRAPRGYEMLGSFYAVVNSVDKALATWEAGLKTSPDDKRLRQLLVRALLEQPKEEYRRRGLALLDESLSRIPDDPEFLTLRALTCDRQQAAQATGRAVAALENALRTDSRDVSTHLNLIELARRSGNADQIRQRLTQALAANPHNVTLLLMAAGTERDLGNPTGATAYAQAVIKDDAANLPARQLLVQLALAAGDFAAAEPLNQDILKLAPEDEGARLAEATILRALRRTDEAITRLEAFRKTAIGKNSMGAMLVLADLYVEKKDPAKAGQQIDEAEKLAPNEAVVLGARFAWLAAQDKVADLLALVNQRVQASARPAGVFMAAGNALAATDKESDLREAIGLFRRAAELEPANPAVHAALAESTYKAKDFAAAAAAYRLLLKIDPDNPDVLNSLAWTLGVMLGETKEAMELAERGMATRPADPHLLDTHGALLLKLNKLEEARADLDKCLALPNLPPATQVSALRHLGEVLAKAGQPARAREAITKALQIDGEKHLLADGERAAAELLLKSLP